jgi:dCTP deaminase
MLSDRDIQAAINAGYLTVDPLTTGQIQPASIDLRLSDEFAWLPAVDGPFPGYVDPLDPPQQDYERITVAAGDRFGLRPHAFVLAATVETVQLGDCLAGQLAGKSSIARHGIEVETAGFVDPGFAGRLTLELANNTDRWIMLSPGMLICQLVLWRLDSPCANPYGSRVLASRYQGQTGPTPSRSHLKVA